MNAEKNKKEVRKLVSDLQETLTPGERRGFVDCFLLRKQSEEVGFILIGQTECIVPRQAGLNSL